MCLVDTKLNILRAEEDFSMTKIFKITKDLGIRSPYQGYIYDKRETDEVDLEIEKEKFFKAVAFSNDIYSKLRDKIKSTKDYQDYDLDVISKGYHGFSSYMKGHKLAYIDDPDYCLVRCGIPKGAYYSADSFGLIVASKIILPEWMFKVRG